MNAIALEISAISGLAALKSQTMDIPDGKGNFSSKFLLIEFHLDYFEGESLMKQPVYFGTSTQFKSIDLGRTRALNGSVKVNLQLLDHPNQAEEYAFLMKHWDKIIIKDIFQGLTEAWLWSSALDHQAESTCTVPPPSPVTAFVSKGDSIKTINSSRKFSILHSASPH